MAIVAALLDKARKTRSIPSDNALGASLHRSRQVVSQWRTGDAYPDEDLIAQLAEMAGEDPAVWLVNVKAERSTGAAHKAWARLAKKLSAAAVLVVAVALPFTSPAAVDVNLNNGQVRHYAKFGIMAVDPRFLPPRQRMPAFHLAPSHFGDHYRAAIASTAIVAADPSTAPPTSTEPPWPAQSSGICPRTPSAHPAHS